MHVYKADGHLIYLQWKKGGSTLCRRNRVSLQWEAVQIFTPSTHTALLTQEDDLGT